MSTRTTLYFLPGTMCDKRLWLATWQHLERIVPNRFNCVHLDIPQGETIANILAKLNLIIANKNSLVVGFSLGGYLATAFNLAYPEKVGKLMVVSNMPRVLPALEIKERDRTIKWLASHGYSGVPLKRIQGLMHEKAWQNTDAINIIKAMDDDLGVETLIYQLNVTTKRENLLNKLAQLSNPVHFCIGKQDHLVDLPYLQEGVDDSANMSLAIHDEVGHMFPLESPEILASEISRFFS